MKKHTTMKEIKNRFNKVYQTGYCDLQNIFRHSEPQYYNTGIYGWNCDIYTDYSRDIAISTGYRNMRGAMIPREIIEKYDKIALEILKDAFRVDVFEALEENKENFLNELLSL